MRELPELLATDDELELRDLKSGDDPALILALLLSCGESEVKRINI